MKAGGVSRVLIVDDEPLIRKGIIHYIDWEKEGFCIAGEASNGEEALELIESVNPHIIMTDIVMPKMDGEELTRVVKEKYPHIKIIILSSFSEFDYVRSTFQNGVVDYILKPKLEAENLVDVLKKAAINIPKIEKAEIITNEGFRIEQMMNQLISGYDVNWDEENLLSALPFSCFYLAGAEITQPPSGMAGIKEKIIDRLLENNIKGVCYSAPLNKNQVILLINIEKVKNENVIQLLNEIAGMEPGIGLALSEEFHDFLHIGKVYKDSLLKLMDYRFYLSDLPLLMKGSLPALAVQYEKFNFDWFNKELKCKRFDYAFESLVDHVNLLSSNYMADIFEYKAFFSNVVFNTTIQLSTMVEYNTKDLETAKYTYFRAFDEVTTAQEAVKLLDSFIEEARNCLRSPQVSQELNVNKLVEYIRAHYAESLTLTEMAKRFHFNPSYLSSYFSTHMQEGFIEYLNKIRIEEAAKLLKKGTIPISEISGMVGYSDHSYFCRVFKKVKGLSPSQYKRLNA